MFSDFENYLKLYFLTDYWYDEGIVIASDILANFNEQDWNDLKDRYNLNDHQWMIRCAEVLDSASHPVSSEILIKFLTSKDENIIVAAADSLRSKSIFQFPKDAIENLNILAKQGSEPVRAVVGNLLEKIRTL